MSWVTDLATGFGIPGAAATVAVAMYSGCAAAETAARPEALEDIGRILKNTSWHQSVRPSLTIQRIFVWTFGERHLTWKCIRRSASASVLTVLSLMAIDAARSGPDFSFMSSKNPAIIAGEVLSFIVLSLLPDYCALYKTRFLLQHALRSMGAPTIVLIDLLLSLMVSSCFVMFTGTLAFILNPNFQDAYGVHLGNIWDLIPLARFLLFHTWGMIIVLVAAAPHPVVLVGPAVISTLLTSVWTILILLSTTVLKLLIPLERFTSWFFDVERHPIKATGTVSAALVMIGGLIWTVLRAIL